MESEFSLEGVGDYKMYCKNIENKKGRGLILYIDSTLNSSQIEMTTHYVENIFIEIKLNGRDKLLVGLLYRSEKGSSENNDILNSLITEARKLNYPHLLLLGDFNYPTINWKNNSSFNTSEHSQEN